MYRDIAVVNTPGLGFLYLFLNAITGAPLLTPWIVHFLTALLTILAGYSLVSSTVGNAAANGAAVFTALLWPQTMGWWEIAQKDGIAFTFALSAMATFAYAPDRKLLNFLAGALLAAAVFTKTSAAIYILPSGLLLIIESKSTSTFLRRALWISLGGTAFLALPTAYLTLHDAWPAVKASVVDRAFAYSGFRRLTGLEALLRFCVLISLYYSVALLLPAFLISLPRHNLRLPIALLAILATAFLGAVLQGRGWAYHAVPVAASTALFLGACFGVIYQNGRLLSKAAATFLVLVTILGSLQIFGPRLFEQGMALAGKSSADWRDTRFHMRGKAGPGESRAMAAWVRSVTDPDDRIFIWGMESQIYIFSERMFVGPSFADAPIWHPQLAQTHPEYFARLSEMFLDEIAQEPPVVFIVARNDANPVEPMASDEALRTLPDLAAFLDANYRMAFQTRNLKAYLHVDHTS